VCPCAALGAPLRARKSSRERARERGREISRARPSAEGPEYLSADRRILFYFYPYSEREVDFAMARESGRGDAEVSNGALELF
jgi:hypothetical protein